jgi:hypothetical protein
MCTQVLLLGTAILLATGTDADPAPGKPGTLHAWRGKK